jgi:hypothetical protein
MDSQMLIAGVVVTVVGVVALLLIYVVIRFVYDNIFVISIVLGLVALIGLAVFAIFVVREARRG